MEERGVGEERLKGEREEGGRKETYDVQYSVKREREGYFFN